MPELPLYARSDDRARCHAPWRRGRAHQADDCSRRCVFREDHGELGREAAVDLIFATGDDGDRVRKLRRGFRQE